LPKQNTQKFINTSLASKIWQKAKFEKLHNTYQIPKPSPRGRAFLFSLPHLVIPRLCPLGTQSAWPGDDRGGCCAHSF